MDKFGDRMKGYENVEAGRHFLPELPVCARLDGKCFSGFTKGLARPYDERLSLLMGETTRYLVSETQARIGYTQSDEISLVYYSSDYKSQIFLDGRIQKMTSLLAAMTSVYFNKLLPEHLPEKAMWAPVFDCRVWQLPTLEEGVNAIMWRESDATKNSISMAAQCYYSHKQLHRKSSKEKQEMLWQEGVNWNDYPTFFKRGTYYQRHKVWRKFTTAELDLLPEKHEARKDPNLLVERSEVRILEMPPLAKVVNRVDVIFNGENPVVRQSDQKKEEEGGEE